MTIGRVAEIWRYPVNGLTGEKLQRGMVLSTGLAGDHLYAIRDTNLGRILDPKSQRFSWGVSSQKPSMLDLRARIVGVPDGEHELLIEASGSTFSSARKPDMNRGISATLGGGLEIVRYPRFRESRVRSGRTLHILTTSSLERMRKSYSAGDFDARRFRPNFVIATGRGREGFVEDGWVGREIRLGPVRLRVEKPNSRCTVPTMRQPGVREDSEILRAIQRENSGNLGVMCTVLEEGYVRVGEPVTLA